ncbi:MAG: hypothetical protein ACTSUC_09840 [Promethearchaeota archaeon]
MSLSNHTKEMKLKLKYQVPIIEQAEVEGDFIIQGTAINSTTTSNNHTFLAEELEKSTPTLRGVPLLLDHKNEVSAIMGRVIGSDFNKESGKVLFKAKVQDSDIQKMIKDGRLNSVSIGADCEDIEESEDGGLIARGIHFRELSFVAVPADSNATFVQALREAYDTSHSTLKEEDNQKTNVRRLKMSEEETKSTEEESTEIKDETETEKEEPKKEEPKDETSEKILKLLVAMDKRLKNLEEADVDEEPKKEEPKKEEPKEEEVEEESEDDEDSKNVGESYKIVQNNKSFSVIKNKY